VPATSGANAAEHAIPTLAGEAPWAPSLFVGAPLLALAAVRAPSRRMLGVIGGLAAAALLVGRAGWPVWLGAPEIHVAALAVVLAVPAADGLDALVLGQRRAVLALALGAGFTVAALAALAALRVQHRELAPAIDGPVIDGALGVVCMVAGLALAWRAPGRRVPVLFALLVAPSVGAAHSLAPTIDRSIVTEPPPWPERAQRTAGPERRAPPVRALRPAALNDHPDLEGAVATFAGASAWRWGIASAHSEDPARSPAHDRTWQAASREGGALLDRYGVALAIVPSTLVGPRTLTALGRRGSWTLVELPAAPAASVMQGWRWAPDPGDALALLVPDGGGAGVLRGEAVLAGAGPPAGSSREPVPCAIHTWQAGEIDLSCTSDAAGYAVVSSAAASGWQVVVDDRDATWLVADVMRRAVAIPAGTHSVRWIYVLPGLRVGAAIALAGVLGLCALWGLGRRPRTTPAALVH
jgi:hypothetical protein